MLTAVDRIEQLTHNVTCEWQAEGRIIIFSLRGAMRDDVDIIVQRVAAVVAPWDNTKPLLVMYDISHSYITPYTRKAAIQVGNAVPLGIRGRTAVLLPQGVLFRIGLAFFKNTVPVQNQAMQREFFIIREKALEWLAAGLEDEP